MKPETRKLAEIANGLELQLGRVKRMVEKVGEIELESRALRNGHDLAFGSSKRGDGSTELFHWPPCPGCNEALRFVKGAGVFCNNDPCPQVRKILTSTDEALLRTGEISFPRG